MLSRERVDILHRSILILGASISHLNLLSYLGNFESLMPFRFAFGNIVILLLIFFSLKHVKNAVYIFRAKIVT